APKELLSDRGKSFVNQVVAHLSEHWNFRHTLSSAYHPQTNGLVERYNKTLAETLAKISFRKPFEWDELIPSAFFAYRTTRHETTKKTPFYLMYGREAIYPIETVLTTSPDQQTNEDPTDALVRRTFEVFGPLEDARQLARTNIRRDQERQQQ